MDAQRCRLLASLVDKMIPAGALVAHIDTNTNDTSDDLVGILRRAGILGRGGHHSMVDEPPTFFDGGKDLLPPWPHHVY